MYDSAMRSTQIESMLNIKSLRIEKKQQEQFDINQCLLFFYEK